MVIFLILSAESTMIILTEHAKNVKFNMEFDTFLHGLLTKRDKPVDHWFSLSRLTPYIAGTL
jgi:hypothetical protein